ncbi:asparagine synthetase domain-containing 1 isoform X2 [Brachionus plicatilis]|uniref:Asparagine synthetase domain-containing 1 isoform X2 n=1 Tax=Brachionus plicatilis TaxID=10195 RepID=A0A3M7RCM6_BRAPC|nr:asparagine synthetase domain-containing 1 isoform X2 [Brachionus plicatilis]
MAELLEKKNIEKKLQEQKVLKVELETLKPNRQVYQQLSNSNIFFRTELKSALSECKEKIKNLDSQIKSK